MLSPHLQIAAAARKQTGALSINCKMFLFYPGKLESPVFLIMILPVSSFFNHKHCNRVDKQKDGASCNPAHESRIIRVISKRCYQGCLQRKQGNRCRYQYD